MKWYQQSCVNKRDYLLEHLEEYALNHSELIMLMMIDFLNQQNQLITHDTLSKKLNISKKEVDQILSDLISKDYLEINIVDGRMNYCFDGIFEIEEQVNEFDQSVFEIYEREFKRLLSQKELERLSEWCNIYEKDLIIYALMEAITYDAISFDYIERILQNWKEQGFSAAQYVEGKRHG